MSIDFPKEEEIVLERWREINAFHRQVSLWISTTGMEKYSGSD